MTEETSAFAAVAAVGEEVAQPTTTTTTTTSTTQATTTNKKALLAHANSFDASELVGATADDDFLNNLPPGRLHAVKGHQRLHGSMGNLLEVLQARSDIIYNHNSHSHPGTPRSRSRSPSIGREHRSTKPLLASSQGTTATGGAGGGGTTTVTTHDANSSISSFDDAFFDQDILTDRAGVQDDLSESQRKLHSSTSKELHLPATVLERMSEDSLEDAHAFTDCYCATTRSSSNASRVSHVSGSNAGDNMLEPLDECDEGLEDDDDNETNNSSLEDDDDGDKIRSSDLNHLYFDSHSSTEAVPHHLTTVILTNMENLTLQQPSSSGQHHHHHPEQQDYSNYSSDNAAVLFPESTAGESSVLLDDDDDEQVDEEGSPPAEAAPLT